MTGFLYAFPVSLYTWYGAMWLIVLFVIGSLTGRSRWWVVASLLVLPGLFTVTTLDGTRVFVCVVAAARCSWSTSNCTMSSTGDRAVAAGSGQVWPRPTQPGRRGRTGRMCLVFLPSLYYYGFNGDIATPWEFLHGPLDPLIKTWENAVQPWSTSSATASDRACPTSSARSVLSGQVGRGARSRP